MNIMPLDETQREILNTQKILAQCLNNSANRADLSVILKSKLINQFIFIGSGDSYAIAQFIAHYCETTLSIRAKAIQSYEFQFTKMTQFTAKTAIFVISASGRASPSIDALINASQTQALLIAVTNQSKEIFTKYADFTLCTGATKFGMPTQSTTATLFLLLQVVNELSLVNVEFDVIQKQLTTMLSYIPSVLNIANNYCNKIEYSSLLRDPIVLLASDLNYYIAKIGVNLLACGPEILSHAFLIEEYHHSLRLLHSNQLRHFLLLLDNPIHEDIFINTANELTNQNVNVTILSAYNIEKNRLHKKNCIIHLPSSSSLTSSFYSLLFLQILSFRLSEHFISQGGQRATLRG